MKRLIPSIVAVLLASLSVQAAQAKERISILDFMVSAKAKKAVNEDASQSITNKVRDVATSLIDHDRFELMTRENILVMLQPGKTNLTECESLCEVDIARVIGSRWHVVGDIKKPGKRLSLSIRLFDVKGGGQLGGVTVEGSTIDFLLDAVIPASRELLMKMPGLKSAPSPEIGEGSGTLEVPAASPPPGASKFVVQFGSAPSGAAVSVDGKFLCQTPNGKAVPQGEHWIEMGKDGYQSRREKVAISRKGQELSWSLSPLQTRLSLEAVDDRTGGDLVADVYVDGVKVGQTPFSGLVALSAQRIEVAPEGFDRKTVPVSLEEGKAASAVAHFRSADPKAVVILSATNRVGTPEFTMSNAAGSSWKGKDEGNGIRFEVPAGLYEVKNSTGCGWSGKNSIQAKAGITLRYDYSACSGNPDLQSEEYKKTLTQLVDQLEKLQKSLDGTKKGSDKKSGNLDGMVAIPAGCFLMGSNDGEGDENPMHQVCLDGFNMDKYAVTNASFSQAGLRAHYDDGACFTFDLSTDMWSLGVLPSRFRGANQPVVCVDWNQAKSYCESQGKRLPTEAEYEYATRAGTSTQYFWGNNENEGCRYANGADQTPLGDGGVWYEKQRMECKDGYGDVTSPVGSFQPNRWGLYDMAGNVWQWTSDWYDRYSSEEQQNPTGPSSGSEHVSRGGGWYLADGNLHSADRRHNPSDIRGSDLGFRCVSH